MRGMVVGEGVRSTGVLLYRGREEGSSLDGDGLTTPGKIL